MEQHAGFLKREAVKSQCECLLCRRTYSKIHCPVKIILGKCYSGQQDLILSVVGVWVVVIQVVREDLTGIYFFLQSIKVKNRKFSVMCIYCCNLGKILETSKLCTFVLKSNI